MRSQENKSGRYSAPMYPPPQSASRALDEMVAASELPYGYLNAPPPAGHENAETLENMKLQKLKKGR